LKNINDCGKTIGTKKAAAVKTIASAEKTQRVPGFGAMWSAYLE
jgi:hypothetical protein